MSPIDILINVGHLLLIINFIVFLKSSQKNKSKAFTIFTYYLLTILIIQLTSKILRIYKIDNIYLSHFYFIGQFLFLSFFLKKLLHSSLQKKVISISVVIVMLVLGIYYALYPSNFFKFNVFEIIITSTPLLIYSYQFFIQNIEDANKKFVYIVSGIFIYILCSTLLFTLGNYVNSSTSSFNKVSWYSNTILYIMYQVLIFIEWHKHFRIKN